MDINNRQPAQISFKSSARPVREAKEISAYFSTPSQVTPAGLGANVEWRRLYHNLELEQGRIKRVWATLCSGCRNLHDRNWLQFLWPNFDGSNCRTGYVRREASPSRRDAVSAQLKPQRGVERDGLVRVLSGLAAGETVVVEGAVFLTNTLTPGGN